MNIPSASLLDRLRSPVDYARDPVRTLVNVASRYGDIVRFLPPRSPVDAILVNRAEWIADVLDRHAWNFSIVRVVSIDRALGQGLLTSHGYLHQRQRRMLAEPFHAWLPAATEIVAGHGLRLREHWQEGSVVDLRDTMLALSIDVSWSAVFGADLAAGPPELREAASVVCRYLSRPSTHPLADVKELVPILPDNRRFWAAMRLLDVEISRRIHERRSCRGDHADLLSMLLDVRGPDTDAPLSNRQVRDECLTLFTAGAGPMAWALTRAWYLLSQHPEAEDRLHTEVDRVLGSRAPCAGDLPNLTYTGMVVRETLRLYPSAWVIGRHVLNDYALDGYDLPAGATVVMSSYVTQRDPRYFLQPSRFLPERWTSEGSTDRPAGAYFPWGGGERSCFGEPFAMLAMTSLLATLAGEWRPRFVAGQPDAFQARFTLRLKHPMVMRLERR